MAQSNEIDKLAEALATAQGEFKPAAKSATNPFLKNRYANIDDVLDAVREPLSKHGLALLQPPCTTTSGKIGVRTVLMHKSGQWIDSEMPVLSSKEDAQSVGSGITYARRYSLKAILGIADDDDDGNGASNKAPSAAGGEKKADPVAKPAAVQEKKPAPTKNEPSSAEAEQSVSSAEKPADEKIGKEQMEQLLAAGKKNGWTQAQISAFICHAFQFTPKTIADKFTWKQWELAVKLVTCPENKDGNVIVDGAGKELAPEKRWPKEAA